MKKNNTSYLPKILYLSDVPAYGESKGGAVIAYRLLKSLPASQLIIVQTNFFKKDIDYNSKFPIPNATYLNFDYPFSFLRNSRFSKFYSYLIIKYGIFFTKKIKQLIKAENVTKLVTLSHGYMYYLATNIAKEYKLPCFAIHHDLYLNTANLPLQQAKNLLTPLFAKAYKNNDINFCVSPFMQAFYANKFTGNAEVLYPNRDKQAVTNYFLENNIEKICNSNSLTFGYLGSIPSGYFLQLINEFATAIGKENHQLHLIANVSKSEVEQLNTPFKNITLSNWISTDSLLKYIVDEIDVLVLIQENNQFFSSATAINFPSKLTEYTQTGLPILVIGPIQGSAYKFAQLYNQAFISMPWDGKMNLLEFNKVLNKLSDKAYRESIGKAASVIGNDLFSFATAKEIFTNKVLSN